MISGPVSLMNPEIEFRVVLSEDRCYFGRVLFRIDRGSFEARNPGRRAFFHPGVMMPRMVRTLINLSGACTGDVILDPFSGTGSTLIEAEMLGMHAVGSDFDPLMARGSLQNVTSSDLLLADATSLPFANHSVDAVVTDFPYGQSVCIKKTDTLDTLYVGTLREIHRVLKTGHKAVIVTHRDISDIAGQYMTILQRHEQRVHKSLTRCILVIS